MQIRNLVAAAAMLATPLLSTAAPAPVTAVSLLAELQARAADAATHANELQTIALTPDVSWQSHAYALEAVRADVNSMGRTLSQLRILRDSAGPEQRHAIDSAALLVTEMAANTSAAVNFLNDHRGNFWIPSYRTEVTNLVNESERLTKSAGEAVQFARLRSKEQRIDKDLGIGAE
ncbi:MAG: hypothetical protein ACE15B_11375 [Bryobacteraceae bacterium]